MDYRHIFCLSFIRVRPSPITYTKRMGIRSLEHKHSWYSGVPVRTLRYHSRLLCVPSIVCEIFDGKVLILHFFFFRSCHLAQGLSHQVPGRVTVGEGKTVLGGLSFDSQNNCISQQHRNMSSDFLKRKKGRKKDMALRGGRGGASL